MRRALARGAARLMRRDGGAMVVELVIMLPLLLWCFAASWVFFDAYRTKAINARSAYTLGDMLSRETDYITPAFLQSFADLQGFLVNGRPTRLRITTFGYDADRDAYQIRWSKVRGEAIALDDTELEKMRHRLPVMPHGEIATMIESWIDYTPILDVGLDPFTFEELVVTRPRFAGQLCYNTSLDASANDAIC